MSRTSSDTIRNGRVWDGFDYNLQVWVFGGVVQGCGHPDWSRRVSRDGSCCNAHRHAGRRLAEIPGAEHFTTDRRI